MAVKEKQKSICPEETVFGNGTCGKAQAEGKDETEESGAGTLSRKHKKKPESEVMTVLKKIGQDIAGQMEYGRNAAYVILDAEGKIVAEDNRNGFDENAKQQIREYLHPPKPVQKPEEKPPLENWQKYMENGEYLRSSEISEEQNYNMIDGRRNNMPPKKTRTSVLVKLHQKQAEIAKRSGKEVPQMAVAEDMERRRK